MCKNAHAVVSVQLGDLPLISNSDVKLSMHYNSIVVVLCTVQWKWMNYFRASSVQDFLGRSHPLSPEWLWYQDVSPESEDSHFEVTAKLSFGLL